MKKLLSLILVFSIIWSVCPALADALTLPDPAVVSGGGIKFVENRDNEHALYRAYSVTGDTAAQQVAPYLTALLQIPQLQLSLSFVENYSDYSGMYYVFAMTEGSCSTFAMGDKINNAAVVLYYDYGGNYAGHNIYLYCSTDFSIGGESASLTPAAPATVSADTQQTAVYSLADAHTLQDPVLFFGDLITFTSYYGEEFTFGSEKNNYYSFMFRADAHGDMSTRMVAAFESYLAENTALEFSGEIVSTSDNIYRCYTLKNAADADLLHYSCSTANEKRHEITASIMLRYESGYPAIDMYFARSFSLSDLNYRLDEKEHAALSEIAAAYALKRAEEEARRAEEEKAAQAAAAQTQSSDGSSSFSWSSSSSSSSQTRTTRCHSCSGDGKVSCSNCSGRGYKEKTVSTPNYSGKGVKYETVKENCYRCHGSGDVDCSSCGGDGKVEY